MMPTNTPSAVAMIAAMIAAISVLSAPTRRMRWIGDSRVTEIDAKLSWNPAGSLRNDRLRGTPRRAWFSSMLWARK
jgi:hypothetical protein